jgi:glycosyltransferase involved in cell wall biosynthesis
MKRHLHYYFGNWTNESRAWRSGALAQAKGYAQDIDYIGYKGPGQANFQIHDERQYIFRLGAEPVPPGSFRFLRALSLPRWYLACLRESRVVDASLIVAHSLAALPVSVFLARRYRLPLIYDAHELETERAGWSLPIRKIAKAVESRFIKNCDHVITVNESIRDWYVNAYPFIDISVVRNVPKFPVNIGKSNLRANLNIPSNALIYVYCGALGSDRGLSELIEIFRHLSHDRHFVMIGYGHGKNALVKQAHGLNNVHFHEAVPQTELVTLLSGADVGIVVLRTDSLSYEYAMPNKLFEYAAAGLGVIVGNGPEMENFAREYPASKMAQLDVSSLRSAICAWTTEELARLKPSIEAFKAPSWEVEQEKLALAFDRAIDSGKRRWGQ